MSSPLGLEQLLTNKKSSSSSSFILLNDTIKLSSLPIIVDVGKRALDQEGKTLIVLLTETSPTSWREQFEAHHSDKIYIIDAYTDPQGWNKSTSTDKNVMQVTDMKNMEKSILSPIIKKAMETPNCTILIDSITPLSMISQHRTYQLVKTLESLTTDAIRLIIGFHSDLKMTLKNGLNLQDSLNRLASVIIKLGPLRERTHFETQAALTGYIPQDTFSYTTITSNNIAKGGIAHIEWRKKSGKVVYESNGFILNEKTRLLDIVPANQLIGEDVNSKEAEEKEKELEAEMKAMKVDPAANLSFNLSLTDEQRKQKENLVLPYLKAQQLEVSIDSEDSKKGNNNGGGGLIYYDPDAADDFDDEDPDEDLDI